MPLSPPTFNHKTLMRTAIVIAFIQFTSALEYMVFNPVFAFMAADFAVPVSFSGYVSGMYTSGAVISGVIAFYYIDRFNKKHFLMANMTLLGLLTLLIPFVSGFSLLLTLRFVTGLVGGTTMGVGIVLLINHAPTHLRGKVLATVIASFPLVSIVGTPTILFLCTNYGWHVALWSISTLCLLALPLILSIIPQAPDSSGTLRMQSVDMDTLLFASGNALVQFSPMLIVPVLVPLMTQQLGASQDMLPWLFCAGGIAGYLSAKMTGVLTSRFSALIVATGATGVFILSLLIPALGYQQAALFITLFLGASYSRLVSSSVVTMQFPDDRQRAGFSSLQTSILYLMTTVAFFLCSFLLPDPGMAPQNLNTLLATGVISAAGFPIIVSVLQKKLAKRFLQPDHFTTG